ncbi:MAG: hypothetical protein HRU40_21765 [Saprospiraceae bacterium]|nr:hypothetical protein [Saprospiraceae bacterium]
MIENTERKYNILVYGIDKKRLSIPDEVIKARNYSLTFEKFNTPCRFNDFDGVILFKGIFETFKWESGASERYLKHSCDQNELDKRKKEAKILIEKGGFLCFLLDDSFLDEEGRENFKGTDLTKFNLNYSSFHRANFNERITHLDIKSDEFRPFLNVYGAASSYFKNYNSNIDLRVLAKASGHCSGMIINRNKYFIPTLIPDNRPKVISEFFTLLAEGITSSYNKLQILLAVWIKEFHFDEEVSLKDKKDTIMSQLQKLKEREKKLDQF